MRILAAVQGHYGNRIFEHIRVWSPSDWVIERVALPKVLPLLIDDPQEFLPSDIPEAELLLAMAESEGAAQLVPALAILCRAKSVIIPVDNPTSATFRTPEPDTAGAKRQRDKHCIS